VEPPNVTFARKMEQAIPGLTAQTLATLDAPVNGPASSPLTSLTPEELKKELDLPALYLHTSGSTGENVTPSSRCVECIWQGRASLGPEPNQTSHDLFIISDQGRYRILTLLLDSQDTQK
jgi:hypothetical protein